MGKGYLESANGISGGFSEAINELFAEWDRDRSPGAIVAVIREGETIHQRGYGVANVEHDAPFTGDTVLRLGSTSKHILATCVLILENRKRLGLDDDIRVHVPEMPDFGTVITLRHLLTMTSGLWDGLNVLLFSGIDTASAVKRPQMLELVRRQRDLMYRPGDNRTYSNSNYALLSLVVERLSGKPLAAFMREEIFEPLGMCRSALVPFDTAVSLDKAKGYVPTAEGGWRAGLMHVELCGDGGIDSTIEDMTRWFLNYRDDGRFGPDYRARMEAENRLNDGRLIEYRLGLNVGDYRGQRKVSHAGGMPGYLCDFVFYPDADLGVILMANAFERKILDLPDRIADIVLERELSKPLASTFVAEDDPGAAGLKGVFASEEDGLIVEVVAQDGKLVCFLLGDPHPLMAAGEGRFASTKRGEVVELQLPAAPVGDGGRCPIELFLGCQPPVTLAPVPDPRTMQAADQSRLQEFTGRYFSEELEETHEISLEDGRLEVDIPSPVRTLEWKALLHVAGDLFGAVIEGEPSCTNVAVRFLRGEDWAVNGLSYSINRCRDVRFRKVTEK